MDRLAPAYLGALLGGQPNDQTDTSGRIPDFVRHVGGIANCVRTEKRIGVRFLIRAQRRQSKIRQG